MAFQTYYQIVSKIEDAANAHDYVASFAHGPIDYLDSNSQNIKYPFVFLRPLTSIGYDQTTKLKTTTFELYAIDVPKLSNESPVQIMSNMEQVILDIGSYMNWGPPTDNQVLGYQFDINTMVPALEVFNDRAYGWVATIEIQTSGVYDYCNYPTGSL